MSNDLCSPFQCNVCLILKSQSHHQLEEQNALPPKATFQLLFTCNGCQLVKYCNKQHQKLDWLLHQEFCQAVQNIKQNFNISHPFYIAGEPKSSEDVEKAILQLKYLLKNALGRRLEYQEEELSSFPTFCGQCFTFKSLKFICKECYGQAYCTEQHSELHKDKHAKVCGLLKTYYCPYKVLPAKEDLQLQFNSRIEDLDKLDLVGLFQKMFSLNLPLDPCQSSKNYQLFSFAADFSCIMSICYAMCHFDIQEKNLSKFNIFILGASVEAVLWFREIHCKLFFLQNPQVMELILDFIGPEVVEPSDKDIQFTLGGSQRSVKFKIYKGLFQDYCKNYKIKPNLMVAFNCGFSEFSQYSHLSPTLTNLNTLETMDFLTKDTWFQGLVEILQTFGTPIVFTSFTEQESQFDIAALQYAAVKQRLQVQIERVFKMSKNPYHDLRPLRQWYTRDREKFYYRNGYIQIISTKLK